MALDYYDKKRAKVRIGHELAARSWTLLGYKEDNSELITDYYDPASWRGIATHEDLPGVLVCVGVSDYEVQEYSGKDEMGVRYETESTEPCRKCNGTGNWPDGATLEQARANPAGQHAIEYAEENGQVLLMGNAVSPLHYHDDGLPKCLYCHGKGHKEHNKRVEYIRQVWPKFQMTPRGRAWHVEKNGKRLGTGTGFAKVAYGDDSEWEPEVKKVVNKIEAVAFGKGKNKEPKPETTKPNGNGTESGKLEVRYDRDWTWLALPSEPPETVEKALRDLGFFFSKKRGKWFAKERLEVRLVVDTITAAVN